jgi:sulfatase maturation enzyme AslB (radical SAM superfamily)
MANLVVTNICNLNCPYCFAAVYMGQDSNKRDVTFIDHQTFSQHLDFLERSQIFWARLIGGEPTLHPHFSDLICQARQRGFKILLFSHGLMPERSLACLETLTPDDCLVLVNMNATVTGRHPNEAEKARRRATVMRLGDKVRLGYNIYQTNFNLDHLLPLIQQANCQRSIRLGLAQPMLVGENRFLHPKQYQIVGRKIVLLAQRAADYGVVLEFDCGFVRCMFSDSDLEVLRQSGANIGWRCNPILDISLNGQAIHCFPLTGQVETAVSSQSDATTLRERLANQTQAYRTAGIYRECSTCLLKEQAECTGGCLANTMRRFRHHSLKFSVPIAAPNGAD